MAFEDAFTLIQNMLPKPSETSKLDWLMPERFEIWNKYVPHVLSLRKAYESTVDLKPCLGEAFDFATLLRAAGAILWHQMRIADAICCLESALKIIDKANEAHIVRYEKSVIYAFLGHCHATRGIKGRHKESRCREMAYGLCTEWFEALSPDHKSQNNQLIFYDTQLDHALTYLATEEYDEANQVAEKCLKAYQNVNSNDEDLPQQYSKCYFVKSCHHLSKGQSEQALASLENALQLQSQSSPEDLDSLASQYRFMLGTFYLHTGDRAKAVEIHTKVMDERTSVWGYSDRRTLYSRDMVATLLFLENDIAQAM